MKSIVGILAAAATIMSIGAGDAATLNDVVVHGPMADRIQERNEISVGVAEKIAKHCVDAAAGRNFSVSVVILDLSGTIVYYYRADGQPKGATESALAKAKTAWNLRAPSKTVQNAIFSGTSSDARQAALGNFPVAGGLPIVVDNQFLGTIGVGGMAANPPVWSDEICGYNALNAVLGPQPPLLPDVKRPGQ